MSQRAMLQKELLSLVSALIKPDKLVSLTDFVLQNAKNKCPHCDSELTRMYQPASSGVMVHIALALTWSPQKLS